MFAKNIDLNEVIKLNMEFSYFLFSLAKKRECLNHTKK